MLAIFDAYRAGLFKSKNWLPNLIAGVIVGIVALPLAMAFAIASGAKPEQGLYTAIIAAVFVAIFGGSRVQIAGPTGAFIVILANVTAQHGIDGLQVATLLAGFILLLMGMIRLGSIIKFIPDPVIAGFTTGIGFIIFIGELKDFFGLAIQIPLNAHFYQKFFILIGALLHFNAETTMLGCFSLFLIIAAPKFLKYIPGPLIAMVFATILQAIFHFKGVATLGSAFGGIPQQLPHFHLPSVHLAQLLTLMGPAFTIALLGAIESLLSAVAADGMTGTRHNSNQELIGQGLANIFAPLFGGFAATGAIARTATNVRNGGNSPLAALTHSLALVLVIILLAPLAAHVPLCTLAAILFVVAYHMSDIPHFIHMIKCAPRYDIIVLVTTFLLTILTDLVVAVNVGVILAMLLFVRRMNQSVVIEAQRHDKLQFELAATGIKIVPEDIMAYAIQGPFFFGVAEKIERTLAAIHTDPKVIIFRLKGVPFIDMTGLDTFSELIQEYHKRGVKIYVCEANAKVKRKIVKIGILQWICRKRIFSTLAEVVRKELGVSD